MRGRNRIAAFLGHLVVLVSRGNYAAKTMEYQCRLLPLAYAFSGTPVLLFASVSFWKIRL